MLTKIEKNKKLFLEQHRPPIAVLMQFTFVLRIFGKYGEKKVSKKPFYQFRVNRFFIRKTRIWFTFGLLF